MKKPSAARRRGSSAETGKVAPAGKVERLPKWSDDSPLSPSKENRAAYGDLLSRYDGLPELLKHKMIRAELYGRGFDLRLSDVVPRETLRSQITGELAEELQAELLKLGPEYSPLQFFEVLMRSSALPFSTRIAAAKEALPYRHERNPARVPEDGVDVAAKIRRALHDMDDNTEG